MSKKEQTLFDKYKAIKKIGLEIEVPYEVMCALNIKQLKVFGDEVAIGGPDCDYVSLDQAQAAVTWLANQIGLQVKKD